MHALHPLPARGRCVLTAVALASLALLGPVPSRAEAAPFVPLPPAPAPAPAGASGLELRVVRYDGSTNGSITVEVRNTGAAAAEFSARGLFFVPEADPDRAPQRLGAIGPFKRVTTGKRAEALKVDAGRTEGLILDVYCIDSHRPSPTPTTPFRVAKERIPTPLVEKLERETSRAARPLGGLTAPAAKASVQRSVWNSRDEAWQRLDGEGAQELNK